MYVLDKCMNILANNVLSLGDIQLFSSNSWAHYSDLKQNNHSHIEEHTTGNLHLVGQPKPYFSARP